MKGIREQRVGARSGGKEGEKRKVREDIAGERVKRGRQRQRKATVRTEAVAVVVVRSGVRRMERRMVKRRKRKREGGGREHRRVRREWGGRRKSHGTKSDHGRVRKGREGTDGTQGKPCVETKRGGGYYGYKVTVTGTVNGSRRTKRVERKLGTVPQSMKGARIGTAEAVAKTSVGTRGVQVSYCYGIG